MTVEETIRQVLTESLGEFAFEFKRDASFVSLGIDSLEMAQLILELEDVLGIEIPDDDMKKLRTVADLVDYAESCTA